MAALLVVALLIVAGYAVGAWGGRRRVRKLAHALNERNEELQAARTELARLSALDGLTQVASHQYFQEFLEKEWRRSLRELTPISLIIIDLDHFKAYNDRLGHQAGDGCLKHVADALRTAVHRPGDVVARYGGEEFVVVLGRTDGDGAASLAAKLQGVVAALQLPHPVSPTATHVTVSLGVATAVPNRGATWQEIELVAAAERALSEAKQLGRNRIATAEFQAT
jgi:diguanylate cyclase (GGDEF)-like protein